jgi:hypothetical protein
MAAEWKTTPVYDYPFGRPHGKAVANYNKAWLLPEAPVLGAGEDCFRGLLFRG